MRNAYVVLIVAAFLAWSVSAANGASGWSVSGAGVGGGEVAGDHLELGAHSDVGGTNVLGSAQNQFSLVGSQFNDGGQVVCLTVEGNRALVLFRYRDPISVDALPGETFVYGGAYIEDNGDPVNGQSVDRMVDFSVQEQNAQFFCTSPIPTFFAAVAQPLTSGNYVVASG